MALKVTSGQPFILRRMQPGDVEAVVALVESKIAADAKAGRVPRLGPITPARLRESFDGLGGLSAVIAQQGSPGLFGAALVLFFEQLEGRARDDRFKGVEAAKLTVIDPLEGTKAAAILHALRVISVTLQGAFGNELTLYYNVLSDNARQLEYLRDMAFSTVDADGRLASILDQRRRTIDLKGQEILTFKPSDRSVATALRILLDAIADRLLNRADRNAAEPHLQGWELVLDHPLLTDERPILFALADEIGVPVPKQLRI